MSISDIIEHGHANTYWEWVILPPTTQAIRVIEILPLHIVESVRSKTHIARQYDD